MNREEPPEEIQIEKNQELESQLNKQVLKILDLEASEIKLSDTIENLNKDRDYLTKCLNDGLAEMKDTRKKYEEMKDKIGALEEKVDLVHSDHTFEEKMPTCDFPNVDNMPKPESVSFSDVVRTLQEELSSLHSAEVEDNDPHNIMDVGIADEK